MGRDGGRGRGSEQLTSCFFFFALSGGSSEQLLHTASITRPMGPVAPIYIGSDAIEWVKKYRLLGITVDDKLSLVPHMLDLKKTFAKKLDLIRPRRFVGVVLQC